MTKNIPIFILIPIIALVAYFAVGGYSAQAVQPREDTIDVDLVGCAGGSIFWSDGLQVATKVTIAVNGVDRSPISLTDIVGDQSGTIGAFNAAPGDHVIVRLYVDNEAAQTVERTIPSCPATSTPTSTSTPAPTNTPAATSTPAPTATPIVITNTIIERVEVPAQLPSVVRPPSTGDGGLR